MTRPSSSKFLAISGGIGLSSAHAADADTAMTAATMAEAHFGKAPFGKAHLGNRTRPLPSSQGCAK
jgi:hypothetical protein